MSLGNVGRGIANAGIEGYLGVKQLFKDLSPEEMRVLKMSRADVEQGGVASKAGQIGGNVGLGLATSVLTPALTVAGRAAPVLNAMAQSAGQAFAYTPTEDQADKYTRKGENAALAAGAGGVLTGVSTGLRRAATRMFTPSADAQTLMNQGVYPTLQQGAENRLVRAVGGLTAGRKAVGERQENEVLNALTNRISNGTYSAPDATVAERVGALDNVLGQEYAGVLGTGNRFPINPQIRENAVDAARNMNRGGQFENEANQSEAIIRNIFGPLDQRLRMNHENLMRRYLTAIQENITDNTPEQVRQALVRARTSVLNDSRNSQLSQAERDALDQIDQRYFDFMRLRDATNGAARNETGINIRSLSNAYQKGPGMEAPGAVNATNEDLVAPAYRALGRTEAASSARGLVGDYKKILGPVAAGSAGLATIGAPATAALLGPLYGISALGQSRAGARFLFGDHNWQQQLGGALNSPQTNQLTMANLLRALRDNSGGIGAGLTPGE